MKTFKFILFIVVAVILKACGPENQSSTDNDSANISFSIFGDSEKTFEFKDPKSGLLVSTAKYPSDWQILSKAEYKNDPIIPAFRYQIKDENGMQAFNTSLKMHTASSNPRTEQMMRNAGVKNVRTLHTKEQLFKSEIKSKLQQRNFSFHGNLALPKLEEKSRKEAAKHATAPFNNSITGTIWQNRSGQKALVILNYATLTQQESTREVTTVWMYSIDILISSEDSFETDVKAFIKGTLESKPTDEWENYMANLSAKRKEENRRQTQAANARMQQSAIAHQQRMAQRQASFDAHQQKMAGISASMDASHASFMNNNFGSGSTSPSYSGGGGQQSFLNMISEEETVYNPGDGNSYQIESGAKETWMDSDGKYINSNDLFFNPNADNSLNNTEWSKVWEDY